MVEYFKRIDEDGEYKASAIVRERTQLLSDSRDYELGYWMQAFMMFFSPGIYFRATDAFGQLNNWMELRYLMEHAIFDPEHPLYGLDYETCSAEDKRRLDVFCEIAQLCCYCGYAILKRERPNFLPKKERESLTKKEEQSIRWMLAYYTDGGTPPERAAFKRLQDRFATGFRSRLAPTPEEIEYYNNYTDEIERQRKRKCRQEALKREAERLSKLPPITYIAAYQSIKKLFGEVFGADNEFVVIKHQFELGNWDFKGKLPATQELVVMVGNDVRSRILLLYIAAHFHHKISVIYIVDSSEAGDSVELTSQQLRECCEKKVELTKNLIQELRTEFVQLKLLIDSGLVNCF